MKTFFLETNQIFDSIKTEEQLAEALKILQENNYSLDKIRSIREGFKDRFEFGTRREHTGDILLLDWLDSQGVDTSKYRT